MKKAIVIGSGVAGLAISIRLVKKGYDVHVYESQNKVGGKVSWIEKGGYKWGLGASLLTLPELIDELFLLADENPKDYYEYIRLDPITRYFFEDGTILEAYSDRKKFAKEIEGKTGEHSHKVIAYLDEIKRFFELTETSVLHRSVHKISTFFKKEALKTFMANPLKMGFFESMHKKNARSFANKNIVQLFDRYATYNGSNPYKAPAILNVIAHPEFNKGGYIMKDGMPSVTQNLYKLAQKLGVHFHLNQKVEEVIIENKVAKGIRVNQQSIFADKIVCNMDVNAAYRKILDVQKRPKKYLNQEPSTSALIFYWGMNKQYEKLDVHNILFSDNYAKEFECLSNGTIYDDPTIYIFISSKVNANHAKNGGENWFTLINVPYNQGQDWTMMREKFKKIIIDKIDRNIGEKIEDAIVEEHINDPVSIEHVTDSFHGALYGNSSNKLLSTFLRHPNFSPDIKNLYFCGGSVHPGGGVPISLLSAKITNDLIA
jgi:phytoene desaturase